MLHVLDGMIRDTRPEALVIDTIQDVLAFREFAIADGILYPYGTEEAQKQKRYLRTMKIRGTGCFAGAHYFDISQDGITVCQRMTPEVVGEYAVPGGRTGSSIEGVDEMLGGGLLDIFHVSPSELNVDRHAS